MNLSVNLWKRVEGAEFWKTVGALGSLSRTQCSLQPTTSLCLGASGKHQSLVAGLYVSSARFRLRESFLFATSFLLGLLKPEKFRRNLHGPFWVFFSSVNNHYYKAVFICGLWSAQVHFELYIPGQGGFFSFTPPIPGSPVADLPGKPFLCKGLVWASSSPWKKIYQIPKMTIRSPSPQIRIESRHETRWSGKHFLTQLCWCFS